MGGSEFGAFSLDSTRELMLANRESALEVAQARAKRARLASRRTRVFEKTFHSVLTELNDVVVLGPEFVERYAPDGYFDPNADLSSLLVEQEPAAQEDTTIRGMGTEM
jgi:hypothetical protein